MVELQSYNEQIADTRKLISDTLTRHGDGMDAMTRFMIDQDKHLLETLYEERRKLIVEAFKQLLPSHITSPENIIDEVYGINHFGPIDPFTIAEHFGFVVIQNYALEGDIGKCEFDGEKIEITYKATQSVRNRFTIAHELGHIFLHFSTGIDSVFTDPDFFTIVRPANDQEYQPAMSAARNTTFTNTIEAEANNFAGQLLVPKRILNTLLDRVPDDQSISAKLLQDFFQVSKQTLEISLKKYGLLHSPKIDDDLK